MGLVSLEICLRDSYVTEATIISVYDGKHDGKHSYHPLSNGHQGEIKDYIASNGSSEKYIDRSHDGLIPLVMLFSLSTAFTDNLRSVKLSALV